MIDINRITASSIDDNLKVFMEEIKDKPSCNSVESEARVYKALMNFSSLLLEKYHEALKSELSKHGIDI